MAFRNSILAGEELVRSGMRSPNYVTQSAGWRVGRDGSAEFNNVTVRGVLVAGDPAGAHVQIGDANPLLAPTVRLWPGNPATYQGPASISSTGLSPDVTFASPRFDPADDDAQLTLIGEQPGLGLPSQAELAASLLRLLAGAVTLTMDPSVANDLDIVATLARIQGALNVTGQLQHNGRRLAGGCRGGLFVGNSSAAGNLAIPHGLGYAPTFAIPVWETSGVPAVDNIAVAKLNGAPTVTTLNVLIYRTDTNVPFGGQPCRVRWFAGESW